MAKITLVLEDTDEHTVLIGGEFPKDTDPKALTHAEKLTFLIGQLTDVYNKQPKAFEFIQNIVCEAATQEGELLMGVMSSEDFHSAVASRNPVRRFRSKLSQGRGN